MIGLLPKPPKALEKIEPVVSTRMLLSISYSIQLNIIIIYFNG